MEIRENRWLTDAFLWIWKSPPPPPSPTLQALKLSPTMHAIADLFSGLAVQQMYISTLILENTYSHYRKQMVGKIWPTISMIWMEELGSLQTSKRKLSTCYFHNFEQHKEKKKNGVNYTLWEEIWSALFWSIHHTGWWDWWSLKTIQFQLTNSQDKICQTFITKGGKECCSNYTTFFQSFKWSFINFLKAIVLYEILFKIPYFEVKLRVYHSH